MISALPSIRVNCDIPDCQGNMYEISNESLVFQQNDLFPSAFPMMEEIRRQGKLCDVVLKVYIVLENLTS